MKTIRVALLSALGLLASARAHALTTVACVGDSITQGSGWSDRLGTKLGASYKSTNYGLSGTTLMKNGDHPYWTSQQFKDSHSTNPNIVVIMLGTNDSKPFNWNAHKGEFVGDYEALIDSYAALPSKPKIYLNLCPPAGTNGFQISGAVIENEINPLIKQIAASKGLPTIDVFSAFGGHNFDSTLYGSAGDQVHPNGAGAQRIADTVYAALVAPPMDGGVATDAASDATPVDAKPDASTDAAPADAKADADASVASDATTPPDAQAGADMGGAAGTTGAAGMGAAGTGVAGSTASGAAGTGVTPPRQNGGGGGCALADGTGAGSLLGLAAATLALAFSRARRRTRYHRGR